MNEEMIKVLFSKLELENKTDIETFKKDLEGNNEMQKFIFDKLKLTDKGATFEQFQSDLGSTTGPTATPTYTPDPSFGKEFKELKHTITNVVDANLSDEDFKKEIERRQQITDEAYKKGEGDDWIKRRVNGALNKVVGGTLVSAGVVVKNLYDKLGSGNAGVDERLTKNIRTNALLDAEIPTDLKQSGIGDYVKYKGYDIEVDSDGKYKKAQDDEGYTVKVNQNFINEFNKSGVGKKSSKRVNLVSLAQENEENILNIGMMLIGGSSIAKGLLKAGVSEAAVANVGKAIAFSAGFAQSLDNNYTQALEEYKGDPDKAMNVAFEKSTITGFIEGMFPGVETGGAFGKSVLNSIIKDTTKTPMQKALVFGEKMLGENFEEFADNTASNVIDVLNGANTEVFNVNEILNTVLSTSLISAPGAYMSSREDKFDDSIVAQAIIKAGTDKKAYNQFTQMLEESPQDETVKEQKLRIVNTIKDNLEVFNDLSKEGQKELALNIWKKDNLTTALGKGTLTDVAQSTLEKELEIVDTKINEALKLKDQKFERVLTEEKVVPEKSEDDLLSEEILLKDEKKKEEVQTQEEVQTDDALLSEVLEKKKKKEKLSQAEQDLYDSLDDFDMSTDRQALHNEKVLFNGKESILSVKDDGVYIGGEFVESGLSDKTNAELGIAKIPEKAKVEDEIPTGQQSMLPLKVGGKVKEFNQIFDVVGFKYDKKGKPIEVKVKNKKGELRKLKSKNVLERVPAQIKETTPVTEEEDTTDVLDRDIPVVENDEGDGLTPDEQAEYDLSEKDNELAYLEEELNAAAKLIDERINKGDVVAGNTKFTEIFDEGLLEGKDPLEKKGNAAKLAKLLTDKNRKIPTKLRQELGKELNDIVKKAQRWNELAKETTPTVKRKTRAEALMSLRQLKEKQVRERDLERRFPGITHNKNIFLAQWENIQKALSKYGIKIVIFDEPNDYKKAVVKYTDKPTEDHLKSRGFFNGSTLYINPYPKHFRNNTLYHEAAHAVFKQLFGRKSDDALMIHESIREVLKNGTLEEQRLGVELDGFIAKYKQNKYGKAEEFFAELVGWMAANNHKLTVPRVKTIRQKINEIMRKLLGIRSYFKPTDTIHDVIHLLNGIALDSLAGGKDITSIIGYDPSLTHTESKFQFIGENGASKLKTAVTLINNLGKAKQFLNSGMLMIPIERLTGWKKGGDGKWRTELNDSNVSLKFKIESVTDLGIKHNLEDILDHPELFQAYPKLKKVKISISEKGGSTTEGFFNGKEIVLGIESEKLKQFFENKTKLEKHKDIDRGVLDIIQKSVEKDRYRDMLRDQGLSYDEIDTLIDEKYNWEERERDLEYLLSKGFAEKTKKTHTFDDGRTYEIEGIFANEKYYDIWRDMIRDIKNEVETSVFGSLNEVLKPVVLHEIQHYIQKQEGFARGGNTTLAYLSLSETQERYYDELIREKNELMDKLSFTTEKWHDSDENIKIYLAPVTFLHEQYKRIAGEVEARNVMARMNMSLEERIATLMSDTEDVDEEDKVYIDSYVDDALSMGTSFQLDGLWHGSPYDFDKFSTDKIGSGEGVQAFGWGLYFTDLKGIAKSYAQSLSKKEITYKGEKVEYFTSLTFLSKNPEIEEAALEVFTEYPNDTSEKSFKYNPLPILNNSLSLLKFISEDDIKERVKNGKNNFDNYGYYPYDSIEAAIALKLQDIGVKISGERNLYKVAVNKGKTTDQYTWLEWKKPISEEQQKLIQKKLEDYGGGNVYVSGPVERLESGDIVYKGLAKYLGGYQKASLFLLEAGIDGVKYPAESISRGRTNDDARGSNYVVFDENAITIEEKTKFQLDDGQNNQLPTLKQELITNGILTYQNEKGEPC